MRFRQSIHQKALPSSPHRVSQLALHETGTELALIHGRSQRRQPRVCQSQALFARTTVHVDHGLLGPPKVLQQHRRPQSHVPTLEAKLVEVRPHHRAPTGTHDGRGRLVVTIQRICREAAKGPPYRRANRTPVTHDTTGHQTSYDEYASFDRVPYENAHQLAHLRIWTPQRETHGIVPPGVRLTHSLGSRRCVLHR